MVKEGEECANLFAYYQTIEPFIHADDSNVDLRVGTYTI